MSGASRGAPVDLFGEQGLASLCQSVYLRVQGAATFWGRAGKEEGAALGLWGKGRPQLHMQGACV